MQSTFSSLEENLNFVLQRMNNLEDEKPNTIPKGIC